MVAFASRARVSLLIAAAAGATLAAALALPTHRSPCDDFVARADDGVRLTARIGRGVLRVNIAMPDSPRPARSPFAAVLVIDRSKSMTGDALAETKRAARDFVASLGDNDAFAIVTYSDGDETLVPIGPATEARRAVAARAIDEMVVDNGTCMSCGIERGAAELAGAQSQHRVRRMLLLTDGRPNLGIRDADELVELAAETARRGTEISTFGIGEDHDAALMERIARAGNGHHHAVGAPAQLAGAFASEVSDLGSVVATDAWLTVRIGDDAAQLPIPDLRAGQTHTVTLRVSSAAAARCIVAELDWKRLDGADRHAAAQARRARCGGR